MAKLRGSMTTPVETCSPVTGHRIVTVPMDPFNGMVLRMLCVGRQEDRALMGKPLS